MSRLAPRSILHLSFVATLAIGSLAAGGCAKIEDSWQYELVQNRREAVNERVRAAILEGLALQRASGATDVPADADVPPLVFPSEDPAVAALLERYGMQEDGRLRGEGKALEMLLDELQRAEKALADEKEKPQYLLSDML